LETIVEQVAEVAEKAQAQGYQAIRCWSQDESRCGLLPIKRHRITAKGIQPIGSGAYSFENFYLYGMTEILTGESFILELPFLNGECFKLFLAEFLKSRPAAEFHLILMDNATFHSEKYFTVYENMAVINFPPYSPELNPIERFWRDVKDWLAEKKPTSLAELSDLIIEKLKSYTREKIKSLVGYEYLQKACQVLHSNQV
jgi:transposase